MFQKIKQTAKHTSIFALGKISTKLVGFILLPIYTKEISVADFGILGLLEVIDLLGSNVLSIGMPQALLRWHSLADNAFKKRKIVFTTFFFLFLVFSCSLILVSPFKESLSSALFNKPQYGYFIIYVFISISFANLARIPQAILRIEEKSLYYSLTILGQFTISLFLNIYFVAFRKLGVEGILIANIISNGLLLISLLPYLIKRMIFKFDAQLLREMLTFSYPFIFIALSTTILSLGDRYILTKLSTLSQVGLYSLGYKISNVVKIFVVDSFTLGLPIIGWQLVKDNERPKEYLAKIFTYLSFVLLWLGLIISIHARALIQVFALNADYWDAYQVIPFLILGVVLLGWQQHLFFILQIPKKTKQISVILAIAAVSNIIANIILIPDYNMMGAAYATIISFFIAFLLALIAVYKYYPIKFEIKRILLLICTALIIFIISLYINTPYPMINIFLKILLSLIYPAILFMVPFYKDDEKKKMREIISGIFKSR
ncbi:MAG: polysaccharide biosynthesis C-terminal domain-containing protein [bacterium]|nr:MAG: polysaccharide biosynthesis C-terminal domain-containing protein [bacterium]